MDKRPIGYKAGKTYILDKKVKANKKFGHIKSGLNTGKTRRDVEILSDKMVAKRRSEVFSRIGRQALTTLLEYETNTESVYNLGGDTAYGPGVPGFPQGMAGGDSLSNFTGGTNVTSTTIKTSKTMKTQYLELNENTEFILLDFREPADYRKYHIREAISFPGPLLKRDRFLPIIHQYVLSALKQEKQEG